MDFCRLFLPVRNVQTVFSAHVPEHAVFLIASFSPSRSPHSDTVKVFLSVQTKAELDEDSHVVQVSFLVS